MPPSPRLPFPRTHLLLDWDSTLTTTDTVALIARIGSSPAQQAPPPFSTLVSAYTTDLHSHTSSYVPSSPQRTTLAAELKFLESLRAVEERSIRRVEEAGVFRGVTGRDVDAGARRSVCAGEVRLRRGWEGCVGDVLRRCWGDEGGRERERRGKVGVVSVGWSARFIRGCLLRAAVVGADGDGHGEGEGGRRGMEEVVGEMEVMANEIRGLDDEGGSSGMLSRWFGEDGGGIWTAGDKGRVVRRLIAEDGGEGRETMRTVYVGDSVTDLECLLLVDVGICIRDEPLQSGQEALREVLERVGVQCRWIGEMEHEHTGQSAHGVEGKNDGKGKGGWWARDFEEIRQSALFRGSDGNGNGIT